MAAWAYGSERTGMATVRVYEGKKGRKVYTVGLMKEEGKRGRREVRN